ncbi:patatin-like phospholipase family protein [Streptomyces sp. NBC_00576]|uniref:patatin-like phospholipase family protein n=1 Tax=Streptomyces sp. NBC_00576 TaxID=2903665 RepID=UPI002E81B75B|nr:patatin-like phospholipase family protein [Streptomyces sp. NBC_00576]WUB73411.1 patatin-like phospholipase family protein [Streptomyces sp. NBC_00576]
MTRRGLVLGGGGVAGAAWQTGLLAGLVEGGVDVLDADVIVGTSAGSTVAAQITSGTPLGELLDRQVDPALQAPELAPALGPEDLLMLVLDAHDGASDSLDVRRRIGAMAMTAPTVTEAERRAVIEARLPSHDWPRSELKIVAVDAETGVERVFDPASGVDLVDAVAASCAVPGAWPPVTIEGRRYIDGGTRTTENADLVGGCDRILVLQVMAIPGNTDLDEQVAALRERGAKVTVIRPDDAAASAIGPDLLDPAVREGAARAGRDQGLRAASAAAAFWR